MTLVLAAVACWSVLGVIGKALYGLGAGPLEVIAFRVAFAFGLLFAVLVAGGTRRRGCGGTSSGPSSPWGARPRSRSTT
ncbi:hypothetical protein H5T53_01705 [Candidatus Bipolaricaulota bacterium]|nr:hypothetical protein [Candidatus Bipolaricaulota bacterium]